MPGQELPFASLPSDPQFKDVLDLFKKDIFLSMFCHGIATVQEFDANKRVVKATMNYKKTYYEKNQKTGVFASVIKDYAILVDCPVIFLGGGPSEITFPVQKGDECLICFNDRDMDNWFAGNSQTSNATARLHSFSDGIAIVGLRSLSRAKVVDLTRAGLSWGQTNVMVGESLVRIANAQYTLNGLMQELVGEIKDLITQIAAITVTCAAPTNPSSPPINAAAITAISTQIATTATKIQGLLE